MRKYVNALLIIMGVAIVAVPNMFDAFHRGVKHLRVGMTSVEVDYFFPIQHFERRSFMLKSGGRIIVIFRHGLDGEQKKMLDEIMEPIDQPASIPYLYGELVIAFDDTEVVSGYSWDGEGRCIGEGFQGRGVGHK
ncbi:hypothetical protein HS121_01990 [bacterium]|nr:hypothetical protein [bacterium]